MTGNFTIGNETNALISLVSDIGEGNLGVILLYIVRGQILQMSNMTSLI